MNNLDRALGVLDEAGVAVPPEKLDVIQGIDASLEGMSVDSLQQYLNDLEVANREQWLVPQYALEDWVTGSRYGYLSVADYLDRDIWFFPDGLRTLIFLRCTAVLGVLPINLNCYVESGGVKTLARAREKVSRLVNGTESEGGNITDITRFRIITAGLSDLDAACSAVLADYPFQFLGGNNYYAKNSRRKYGMPWRGVNTTWAGINPDVELFDLVTTEIQFVTRRVWAVSGLDHPFNASKIVKYPDEEMRSYVRSLMLKASILDFEERFGSGEF